MLGLIDAFDSIIDKERFDSIIDLKNKLDKAYRFSIILIEFCNYFNAPFLSNTVPFE